MATVATVTTAAMDKSIQLISQIKIIAKRPGAIHIATLEHWLLWLLAAAFHVIFGAAKQKVREARAKILEGTSTFVDFGLFEYATWCSTQCCVFLNVRVEFC